MKTGIWYSRLLVLGQMLLIVSIVSPLSALWSDNIMLRLLTVLFIALAIMLALWALVCMRVSNFSIMPEPSASASLITTGPYRLIRHPMYSAVLLASSGAALAHQSLVKCVLLLLLCFVLALKIRREEHLLGARFSGYANYRTHTWALLPRVF